MRDRALAAAFGDLFAGIYPKHTKIPFQVNDLDLATNLGYLCGMEGGWRGALDDAPALSLVEAVTEDNIEEVRALFLEYARSLGFDLRFQMFDRELAGLPGDYRRPDGLLLLALVDGAAAGCAAMRKIGEGICEMKRMYVRPRFRGRGVGRVMAMRIIDAGRQAGYERMRLDTIETMGAAIALYESIGFSDIQPYRYNPVPGARYMELAL